MFTSACASALRKRKLSSQRSVGRFGMAADGFKWVFERGRKIMSSCVITVVLLLDIYFTCVIGKTAASVLNTQTLTCSCHVTSILNEIKRKKTTMCFIDRNNKYGELILLNIIVLQYSTHHSIVRFHRHSRCLLSTGPMNNDVLILSIPYTRKTVNDNTRKYK